MNNFIDIIIRIKNAALAKRRIISIPYSKMNKEVSKVLVKEGFLEDVKEEVALGRKTLKVTIKYEKRTPVLAGILIISKPSLRVYEPSKKLPDMEKRGRRTLIISTNQGIMTGKEARKKGIGGEILFAIW